MTDDARFEDAYRPLRLLARDDEDLRVLASLCQDAVLTAADMGYETDRRRFGLLLGRFRWEERRDPPERVRALLTFEDVLRVRTDGIDRSSEDVLSLLDIAWEEGEDGTGAVTLLFAGDGAIRLDVEALEAQLRDVTKPYLAPSGRAPGHE